MEPNAIYIHYGTDQLGTLDPIKNWEYRFTKPHGGLWASREDDPDGWKNWCEREGFRLDTFDKYFRFTLKADAKVLRLSHKSQLVGLPTIYSYDYHNREAECCLDFEKLSQEYDAIEVTNIGRLCWPLYAWDCNSILVMNPDILQVLED